MEPMVQMQTGRVATNTSGSCIAGNGGIGGAGQAGGVAGNGGTNFN